MTDHKPTHRQDIRPRHHSARSSTYVPINRTTQEPPIHKTHKTAKQPKTVARSNLATWVKGRFARLVWWWKRQDSKYRWKWRAANGLAALLIVSSVITPVWLELQSNRGYQLSNATLDLVGKTDPKLTSKLTYNAQTKTYQFNKESIKQFNPVDQLKAQVGTPQQDDTDKALYSLDVPQDPKQGVTYYDTNSQLSFKLIPQFGSRTGKLQQQRLVYPLDNNTQAIYTLKNNGLKEDIVVQKATQDTMRFSYRLQLPKTLEARALDDGSGAIGIYSGNPSLFSNMSYGSDKDRELVEKARENASKDTLVFGIPAPIITTAKGDDASKTKARFELKDNTLTVVAEGLTSLKQPFSIDPSVVITSATDFETGNNEGNISFATAGQVTRDTLTGGTLGEWHFTDNSADRGTSQGAGSGAANGLIAGRTVHGAVAYNGYVYVLGGSISGGSSTATTERAAINADGTLGTWTADTPLPEARAWAQATAYNGYIYISGGGAGAQLDDVIYAAVNLTTGALGSWQTTTSMPVGRLLHQTAAYNGKMYIVGGCTTGGACNTASPTARVYCTDVYPSGSLGAWVDCNTTNLGGLQGHGMAIYNGYIYVAGGCAAISLLNCSSAPNTVKYSKINGDGSLGDWQTGTTTYTLIGAAQSQATLVVKSGYLYLTSSWNTNSSAIEYAPINANGTVGSWAAATSFNTARTRPALVSSGNYLYIISGCTNWSTTCSNATNSVEYVPINPAGVLRDGMWNTGTSVVSAANSYGRAGVIYNGFMYFSGGIKTNGNALTEVQYATINANGSLGTWATTTSMNAGRLFHGMTVYDGWLYVSGGSSTCTIGVTCAQNNTTAYARICDGVITTNGCNGLPNGAVGTWTAGSNMPAGTRNLHGMTAYKGYLYVAGTGNTPTAPTSSGGVTEYAQINPTTHAIGAWATTGTALAGQGTHLQVYNNRLYGISVGTGTLYVADINNSGTVNAWNDANAADASGGIEGMAVTKGYLYVLHNDGTAPEYAKINSDGTVTSWATTTMNNATGGSSQRVTATDGNALYHINFDGTTQYQLINNGGSGDNGAWNNTSPNMTPNRSNFFSFAKDGYMYAMGGYDNTTGLGIHNVNFARYAPISATGMVGSWSSASGNWPNAVTTGGGEANAAYTMLNGYVYEVGGGQSQNIRSGSSYAAICTGTNTTVVFGSNTSISDAGDCTTSSTPGTMSDWKNTGVTLNTGRSRSTAVAYNGYLYIVGGCSAVRNIATDHACGTFQNTIEAAAINPSTGAIGSWTTMAGTYNFAAGREFHQAVGYNGRLYILGGCSSYQAVPNGNVCNGYLNDVQQAVLNGTTLASDAGCGAVWCKEPPLPVTNGIYKFQAVADSGYLYVTGGNVNGTFSNTSYKAAMGTAGSLGRWEKLTTNFTNARNFHGSAIYNGSLYVMAGEGAGNYADVQFTGLNIIPRKGLYSKLIDLLYRSNLRDITYNGLLANGESDITYRTASSTGVFSSTVSSSGLAGARCIGANDIRYIQVSIVLDDTYTAVFPDANGTARNITDFTALYEFARPTNIRLRHGAILQQGVKSDLDICKLKYSQ